MNSRGFHRNLIQSMAYCLDPHSLLRAPKLEQDHVYPFVQAYA